MFDPDVPQFKVGDLLTAAALNDIVSQLNTLKKQFNDRNQPTRNDSRIDHWMGVLRDTGPNSEANYTDARYWVQRLEAATSSTTNLLNVSANTMTFPDIEKGYVTATNISEISLNSSDALTSTGSHTLNEGTLVHVFAIQRNASPPAKFYWFHTGGSGAGPTWIKITGNATGAGKYTGRVMTAPTATPDTTSAVAEADVGVAPASDDCYVFNMHEIYTSAGHALYTAGSQPQVIKYWFAVKHPKAASDGKPIYLIGGTDIYGCG